MIHGLEALDRMRDGEILIDEDGMKYKMVDGVLFKKIDRKTYVEIIKFDLTKEFDIFKERLVTEWDKVKCGETYYRIYTDGSIEGITFENDGYDNHLFNVGNYFNTRKKAEEIDFKQELFRKLQRFADENNEKIDWCDGDSYKFYITYDYGNGELRINANHPQVRRFGVVYFSSEEIGEQAIELFEEDLLKYFNYDISQEVD